VSPISAKSPWETVAFSAQRFPDNEAIHIPLQACSRYSSKPVSLTYRELEQAINEATTLWQGTGIAGRVALVCENRVEFLIHWLALNALGLSAIPINHEMPDQEIPYYLEHGEAVAVCALTEHRERFIQICVDNGLDIPVVDCNEIGTLHLGKPAEQPAPDPHAECALLYTSGSTGKPKGCILSNDYFLEQGHWYRAQGGYIELREGEERLLTPLPLSHMNAMSVSTMAMFSTGGCLIQLDRFHPATWWETVRDSQATALHYLGVLPAILLALPESDSDDFSGQIRFGFGAGVNPAHHQRFEQRFGFPLVEAWAMTECGAGGAIIASHEPRHVGSCCFGRPGDPIEWQLVDENKKPVSPGMPGELRVRAKGSDPKKGYFSGYLKNPEATKEAWLDGWLNTGDVVQALPDGNLIFVDRRKNIIRRSGENISALEVEAAVSDHPSIQMAVATAVPDDMRGDEVALCVIPHGGCGDPQSTAESIQAHVLTKLAYFKAPAWVVFSSSLPVTASNKPKRADIKKFALQAIEEEKAIDLRHLKKRTKSA
jgi:acyl-CoA synthetase (AMP-forming)/AMP-acid ligase II